MSSPKSRLVVVLGLAVAVLAAVAVRQYFELNDLRLRQIGLAESERADLEARLAASAKRVAELERELASLRARGPGHLVAGGPGEGPPGDAGETFRARFREGGRNEMNAMLDNPAFQKLMASQQRARLDARYAALFKSLKLSPADLEKFKNFLVEKQTAAMDVMAAARGEGLDPRQNRDEVRALVASTQAELDASIKATLGDAAYAQYKSYEATAPQRDLVGQLSQRLSYTDAPLNDGQTEQLVRILADTAPPPRNGGNAEPGVAVGGPEFAGAFGSRTPITNEAVTRAQGVLAPAQLQALTDLQQQQQAQAEMAKLIRAQRNAAAAAPAAGQTPAPAKPPGGG